MPGIYVENDSRGGPRRGLAGHSAAGLDSFGRETLTFVRTLELSPTLRRRFDATLVSHPASGHVVDYLGTHQHLAVDLDVSVDDHGALHISSGEQRFREGPASSRSTWPW